MPKDALGLAGERLVFDRLRADPGARIVACNVENYYCELDVIYRDLRSREIAFVEVKTRRRESELRPTVEAVDARRRKKIALAARRFVRERGFADLKRRYDIAVVLWSESAPPEIAFYKGAFREEDALSDYRDDDFGKNRFAQTE
ncbi:MAG: YraN family protein [Thermoguttaceae bacterium]|nr:YraN family protein [Thermoguttaceae bacterium]